MIYVIGLGSNLDSKYGDQYQTLKKSIDLIKLENIEVMKASKIYVTEPVGMTKVNWFLNAAIIISTSLKPNKLIIILKEIEKKMGREMHKPNTSRPCDLDILLSDKNKEIRILSGKYPITIPHKKLHQRMFVLRPLMDICPELIHPVFGKTIKNIISNLNSNEKIDLYNKKL
jgi:dihydroneopterin aldolase/2-amino-4-hydroxy-6-hydroxymethyldihydropteridine diphosphokinase